MHDDTPTLGLSDPIPSGDEPATATLAEVLTEANVNPDNVPPEDVVPDPEPASNVVDLGTRRVRVTVDDKTVEVDAKVIHIGASGEQEVEVDKDVLAAALAAVPPPTPDERLFGPRWQDFRAACLEGGLDYDKIRDETTARLDETEATTERLLGEMYALLPKSARRDSEPFRAAIQLLHLHEQMKSCFLSAFQDGLVAPAAQEVIANNYQLLNNDLCGYVSATLTLRANALGVKLGSDRLTHVLEKINGIVQAKAAMFAVMRENSHMVARAIATANAVRESGPNAAANDGPAIH
jgi:hypothetical protein